ncbi:MAG: hypothetical protein A3A22_02260 [Candidatus Taylorbacteria bacterium RIFCSPLOWO2_01_FULL_45_34b]|nr:MAG: hypothetical protein A3A22_02260 [Candidatus Taylorbacteria bacterium RIFCSPLOWO2_01_FULL_45_34b]
MSKGKWFFSCVRFDFTENNTADAEYEDKVELKTSNEDGAIIEAQKLWEEASVEIREEWNKQKYPKNPRVFYEVQGLRF